MMADVTGDGLADLVSTRVDAYNHQLIDWRVARNLGGTLASPSTWYSSSAPLLPLPSNNLGGLTSAETSFTIVPHDYDQDGVTDLLFYDAAGSEITWLRSPAQGNGFTGNATGIFVPQPLGATNLTPSAALYADVDGDGVLDLIQCNERLPVPGTLSKGDWQVRRWSPG
jgi:FG-GAP-like repeat